LKEHNDRNTQENYSSCYSMENHSDLRDCDLGGMVRCYMGQHSINCVALPTRETVVKDPVGKASFVAKRSAKFFLSAAISGSARSVAVSSGPEDLRIYGADSDLEATPSDSGPYAIVDIE
jgi:hypothetical protein